MIKFFLKKIAQLISIENFERPLAFSIIKNQFPKLLDHSSSDILNFKSRERVWDYSLNKIFSKGEKILFLEFGSHAGYSMNYISNINTCPESIFFGLDTFYGLPERWGTTKKGRFNMNGKVPLTKDSRVNYVKGMFQDTYQKIQKKLIKNKGSLLVYYDADLYSSTLFALIKVHDLRTSYVAIFDEFSGHECRALYNYSQAFRVKIDFLGKTVNKGYPMAVICRITNL